jgi:hypothetical protein
MTVSPSEFERTFGMRLSIAAYHINAAVSAVEGDQSCSDCVVAVAMGFGLSRLAAAAP